MHRRSISSMLSGIAGAFVLAVTAPAGAQQGHQHSVPVSNASPAPFVASTAKPFPTLMDDAMTVMDDGMRRAPMNGIAEHDFASMMIPHHQGAIDMAKALLLYTDDPGFRNLALGIITEQQNEINLMRVLLQQHQARQSVGSNPVK